MSSNSPYQQRIVDAELADQLEVIGAVVIEGPKASGKTSTAHQISASEIFFDAEPHIREMATTSPALILDGPTPRLLDEWQLEPAIWNHIRRAVDQRGEPGQFILTGSAVPTDDITRHTGTGRITRLHMRTMTLFEAGVSSGQVSLSELLNGSVTEATNPGLTVQDITREITVGGWPGLRKLETKKTVRLMRNYLNEVCRVDVNNATGTRHDPNKIRQLLRSLARNTATHATITTLSRDTSGFDEPVKVDTIRDYLDALQRLMIIEDQPAWAPHLRSKYVLRSAAKRHFVDPSLACAALRATPDRLLKDFELLGFLFESMVVRDLRVYAQANDAEVLQYRDSNGLEVDIIVQVNDGRWAAFEVKLGQNQIDAAAVTLNKFAAQIDTDKSGAPVALGVIVATGYAYTRTDGIHVIPIGTLRH